MNYLLNKYLPQIEFSSYEEFKEKLTINVPEDFNFGYDVVDAWAKEEPDKKALVWVNEEDEEHIFTFTEISRRSNQVANYLKSLGFKKGDVVMMILRRRWEYWVCATALHKLGVILIPATLQLTKKDIVYRGNAASVKGIICVDDDFVMTQTELAASVKGIICVDDDFVMTQTELAEPEISSLEYKFLVGGPREGWNRLHDAFDNFSDEFERPTGEEATRWNDVMLVYFTSGTTGMPKLVQHNFAYPLGHIVTAKYWQHVEENHLHMSVSDSGWAKFGWGKIYGQWICGAVIFCYDMVGRFNPKHLLSKVEKYRVTTFCAPPTISCFRKISHSSTSPRCTTARQQANRSTLKSLSAGKS